MTDLEALLPAGEPHAALHDALVLDLQVDYARKRLVAHIEVCIGDPAAVDEAARERHRSAGLIVEELQFCVIEPPGTGAVRIGDGLWLTAFGPLADASTEVGKALAARLPPDMLGWFLFFSDLNAFAYIAGQRAEVRWI
jgi:hypothetical protein